MATPPPPPRLPSTGDELDKLIKASEESIKRLEQLQNQKRSLPFTQRVSNHFRKHGNNLISTALAGSVFVVALGRLNQKYEYQAEKAVLEAQQQQLRQEKERLQQEVAAADSLAAQVEHAAAAGGRQLAGQVSLLVQEYRQQQAAMRQGAAAAGDAVPPKPPPPGQPPRAMI